MLDQFLRTSLLLGKEGVEKLTKTHVAIFGVGGVGSYTIEALARSGVGTFSLFDNDTVSISNINRQLIATIKTVGLAKVKIMKDRILDINPTAIIYTYECFFSKENVDEIKFSEFNYIVDAIDTVTSKILLIQKAKEFNVSIISSMGAGNKLDPTKFEIADLYETSICPLAKVLRKELRKKGIEKLKVVYSKEPAMTPLENNELFSESIDIDEEINKARKKQIPGSVSFVPSVVGLIIAGEVIKDISIR